MRSHKLIICFGLVLSLFSFTAKAQTFRILALGDSYTICEGMANNNRWPNMLADKLKKDDVYKKQYDSIAKPVIIAKTGWTTGDLLSAIEQQKPNGNFQLVTLLIGVNNQYRGYSKDEYRKEFKLLLSKAIAFANKNKQQVVVLSIPDWTITPYAITHNRNNEGADVDAFNAINKQEAKDAGVRYVNVTGISRMVSKDADLVYEDGLHPSAKMYKLWVDAVVAVISK